MQRVLVTFSLNTEGTETQRTQRDFEICRPPCAGPSIPQGERIWAQCPQRAASRPSTSCPLSCVAALAMRRGVTDARLLVFSKSAADPADRGGRVWPCLRRDGGEPPRPPHRSC